MNHLYSAPDGFLVGNKCHVNGLQDESMVGSEGGKNCDLNGLHMSNGFHPVVIVDSNKRHNNKTDDDEDTDSGIKDGELEGEGMFVSPINVQELYKGYKKINF